MFDSAAMLSITLVKFSTILNYPVCVSENTHFDTYVTYRTIVSMGLSGSLYQIDELCVAL